MFVAERQEQILKQLEEHEKVKVKELSQMFDVTEDCIRKDLASLEERGLLKRAYGGAVKIKPVIHESKVAKRRNQNLKEKQNIAKKAVKLISNRDVVFLDISTTNIEIAKEILGSGKKVTVVTNMLDIANVFANVADTKVNFILIGGTFNRGQDGFLGGMTLESINKFNFDIGFMGVVGANITKDSVTTYAMEDGICKEKIIQASKKVYLVMETMKFDLDANYKFTSFTAVDGVICEKNPGKEVKEKLEGFGTKLY